MQSLAFIQNLQTPELVIIFLAVLLIFGPKSLPKLGRAVGSAMREFREATNKVTESINSLDEEPPPPPKPRPKPRSLDQEEVAATTSPKSVEPVDQAEAAEKL